MYTKEQFHETVGILVKAYMDDTLEHASCCACAVGNIIAARNGYTFNERKRSMDGALIWDGLRRSSWQSCFITYTGSGEQRQHFTRYFGSIKEEIDSSGYSLKDLAKIEFAFESAPAENIDDGLDPVWMFNGLMAVVDVLCEIHGMNEEDKKDSKALFVKP